MKHWFKLPDDSVTNLRFLSIARKVGQPPAVVSFVYIAAMSCASASESNGSLRNFHAEDIDAFGGIEDGTTASIIEALTAAGMITEDGCIADWETTQSVPTEEAVEDRRTYKREWARRKREESRMADSPASGQPVDSCRHDVDTSGQPVDSCRHHREKIREDKIRDLKDTPLTPQGEQGVCEGPAEDCSDVSTKTQPVNTGLPSRGANASWWREFASLWDIWPNQQGKDAAWAVYYDLRRRKIDMPPLYVLRDKASAMIAQDRKFLAGYAPELKTWLREHRWNDEPCPPRDVAVPGRGRSSREQQMATDVERAAEAARRFEDFFEMAADDPAAEGVFA